MAMFLWRLARLSFFRSGRRWLPLAEATPRCDVLVPKGITCRLVGLGGEPLAWPTWCGGMEGCGSCYENPHVALECSAKGYARCSSRYLTGNRTLRSCLESRRDRFVLAPLRPSAELLSEEPPIFLLPGLRECLHVMLWSLLEPMVWRTPASLKSA